jgi:hypothetical protein
MSRGLYSDPFLKALLENEPKLAQEFLEAISNSEYVEEPEIVTCLEVPGWVVEKAGIRGLKNPNFPSKAFEKLLEDKDFASQNFWATFEYPNLTQMQIDKLMKSKDETVRALALAHPLGNPIELMGHLEKMISNKTHNSYVIIHVSQNISLSDQVFSYLFSIADYAGVSETVGQALWENTTLSDEQKAALVLADIKPKEESSSDFWSEEIHFVSSIPFFHSLKVNLGSYKGKEKLESIPPIKQSIGEFFTKNGHHLSLVLPQTSQVAIEPTLYGLHELVSLHLLHRLFWTDLCQRDDFEIYRRNAYRTDDLFISHEILGREFDETAADEATKIGGVLYYDDQGWIVGEEELSEYRAAVLLSSYGEPMVTILENGNYESIGQYLVALSCDDPDIRKKYGLEVTDAGLNWMVEAALEITEPDDFDVSADLNPDFGESLSWAKLPDAKKDTVFEFLKLGFNYKKSKLRNDSIHFLGCMALHESTPKTILEKLAKLNDPLVDEVLAGRNL